MKKRSAIFSFFGLLVAIVLFGLLSLTSCSSGFGIHEFESDSTYIEITSSDSITHFYKEILRFDKDMWCFKHAQWEVVEVR